MKISREDDVDDKISTAELTQLGIKLKRFVENYRKYVLINTPNMHGNNSVEILKTLDEISHKLITRQYKDLFDNLNIIDESDEVVPF